MREKHKTISWRLFNSVEDIAKSTNSALADIKLLEAGHLLLAMFTTGTRVANLINSPKFIPSSKARAITNKKFPFYIMDDDRKISQGSIDKLKNNVFNGAEQIEFVLTNSENILTRVQEDTEESLTTLIAKVLIETGATSTLTYKTGSFLKVSLSNRVHGKQKSWVMQCCCR